MGQGAAGDSTLGCIQSSVRQLFLRARQSISLRERPVQIAVQVEIAFKTYQRHYEVLAYETERPRNVVQHHNENSNN